LIPELCKFAGLLDEQKNDTRFKQKLAKYTKLDAQSRFQRINDYAKKIQGVFGKNKNNVALEQPVSVQGYSLKDLTVEVNGEEVPLQDGNYLRNIQKKIQHAASFENWILMYNSFDQAKELMGMLQQCAKTFGITFKKPMCVEVKGNRANNFTDALQKSIQNGCQIVVTLLDHKTRWVYNDIKKVIPLISALLEYPRSPFPMCVGQYLEERSLRRVWYHPPNERESWTPYLACP
jgi:hypothetical protein